MVGQRVVEGGERRGEDGGRKEKWRIEETGKGGRRWKERRESRRRSGEE